MKRYYIGLAATWHDPSIAIVGPDGDVLFAEAVERVTQDKRGFCSPPDHILRVRELIREYCGPDPELVVGVSWSTPFLRFLQAGVLNELGPLPGLAQRISAAVDRRYDHLFWPYPTSRTMRTLLRNSVSAAGVTLLDGWATSRPVDIRRYDHHLTHAAFACYSSPFHEATCAVVDGYGEWSSTGFFGYHNGRIERVTPRRSMTRYEIHSLGNFYTMMCGVCGFEPVKGEEWKVMGLAPYGRVDPALHATLSSLIEVRGLDLVRGVSKDEEVRIYEQLRAARRPAHIAPIEVANVARTAQVVFSEKMTALLTHLHARRPSRNLVLSGGCALNSSCNGELLERTPFRELHVPCAPGDDGNSVGAAWLAYHEDNPQRRHKPTLLSPFLGTDISTGARKQLVDFNQSQRLRQLPDTVADETAKLLAEGKIVGWMQGRAEFGPRALGHRSILADPRPADMKDRINARVKFREEFRPFAPSILHEYGDEYFERYQLSPYMARTMVFRPEVRARVPAVVHEDGTGRAQSVTPELCGRFHAVLKAFHGLTGVPLLLNTSFNIMGKPMIHTVQDAVGMFYTTGLDALVIDDVLIEK